MAKTSAVARVLRGEQLECQVISPLGEKLTLTGRVGEVEPEYVEGSQLLTGNRALLYNAWAFAKFTHLKVSLPSQEEQKAAAKRAEAHEDMVGWIADLADDPDNTTKRAWCSGCFEHVDHHKMNMPMGHLPAYLCSACGTPTLPCADPTCDNMAIRERGGIRLPRYCAEHRHDIPSFAKAADKMPSLGDYRTFLEFEKANLRRATRLAGVAVSSFALAAPAALLAAPAIGGAVGSLVGGYSGAAASSYGLALLGGGSIASGGMGMAGGAAVVTAFGGALGGAVGASVMNAYVREDKSFHIEMLQGGRGVPVVVCNGFLSQSGRGWGEWKRIVTTRYPDSPVYRVHWGSKELKDLGILAAFGAVKAAGPAAIKQAALAATKVGAKKLGPLTPILLAASLAKNPWHVAKTRANKTGAVVADLLARTEEDSYVLIGHSLGARAMVVTAQALSTKKDGPRIQAMHITGAAIGAKSDWESLTDLVDDAVYNYHSSNDSVLKYLYAAAELGESAAGIGGFVSDSLKALSAKVRNIDVSAQVNRHSDYYEHVSFC